MLFYPPHEGINNSSLNMDKTKQFIRHELLNIFTIIYHFLDEKKLTKNEREEALKLMKIATLLVAHEETILGSKPACFLQHVSLQDILESQLIIAEEKLTRKKSKIVRLKENPTLLTDRYHFNEAIGAILTPLLATSQQISFAFDEGKNALIIHHDGGEILPPRPQLKKTLHEKHRDGTQIMLHLALILLEACHIKTQEKPGKITLTFQK